MKKTKLLSLLLSSALALGLLAGCGGGGESGNQGGSQPSGGGSGTFDLNVVFASEPETMDPTMNRTVDGGVMTHHLYEGLYKWVDDGTGNAVLVPGQAAAAPEVTENADGTCTYTFTLRDGLKWSDGQAVTAQDFVYAWRRLVDPATAAPYNYMLNMVVNAQEIMDGKAAPDQLGVSAPDERTFVVDLTYNCPYFLEVCAFPTCMPLREDIISQNPDTWTDVSKFEYVSNGPYRLSDWKHNASITMVKNDNYYNLDEIGPDSITFKLMDDQRAMLTAFNNGELDYMQNPPVDEAATLLVSGALIPADYLGTYYACFNNAKAPFDNPLVRRAFSLAIDRNYVVEQITQAGELPAGGWVPSNMYDAQGEAGDDFRTVGGDYLSVQAGDYAANCEEARQLLADAGYPGGEGFPPITYLYNTDNRHNAIAEALQQMWKEQLGVEIQLDNQDWNVFLQTRASGDYNICRNAWTADYNDPLCFLDMFMSDNGNNDAHYANPDYDALIGEVMNTSDAARRMELMHRAEQILIEEDAAIAPIFFYTQPYMIQDRVDGMFYTPLGYFFFMYSTPAAQ